MKTKKLKDLTLGEIKKLCDSRKKCDGCEFNENGDHCFVFRLSQIKLNELFFNDKRWKPNLKGIYWYIDDSYDINNDYWDNHKIDNDRYNANNIFKTKEEAEFKLEQIKVYNELKNYSLKNNVEKINWKTSNQSKFVILYNHIDNKLVIGEYSYIHFLAQIYFTSMGLAQQAIKEIGEDRIKKYLFEVK